MKFLRNCLKSRLRRRSGLLQEQLSLVGEINKAKAEWIAAQNRFEEAVGKDQVDYAIYLLEASEKRYELLLKHAKNIRLNMQNYKKQDCFGDE